MTTIFFVRHAQPNLANHDDITRELTAKGMADCRLVVEYFENQPIEAVFSSPFRRAADTVRPLADARGLAVQLIEDFRERKIGNEWIDDFNSFAARQWADFTYKLPDGESLLEVQMRNVAALRTLLREHAGKTLVIGSHGTALSAVINHYVPSFGHAQFEEIRHLTPWIVRFDFEGENCLRIESHDVHTGETRLIFG